MTVFLGNGDGSFQAPQTYALAPYYDASFFAGFAVRAGDLNGDGIEDLIVDDGALGSVLIGKGDGTFLQYQDFTLDINSDSLYNYGGDFSVSLALGDINGDGKLDAVIVEPEGTIVLLGNGDGTFQVKAVYAIGYGIQTVLADFDQDGKLDIAIGIENNAPNPASGDFLLLRGNGDGTFQTPVNFYSNLAGTGSLIAGDFNGDGRLDLATSLSTKQELVALGWQTTDLILAKEELGPGTTTVNATYGGEGDFKESVSNAVKLSPNGTPPPSYAMGFLDTSDLVLNGNAQPGVFPYATASEIELTTGYMDQAGSVFYAAPQNIEAFTTDFTFQFASSYVPADGLTFTIQNAGPDALGSIGGGLGYKGIAKSVAIKFDTFNNSGEGKDSTGIYIDGASPELPAVDMSSSGFYLTGYVSGSETNIFDAHITYDGVNLTLKITNPATLASFSDSWPIDIPGTVGETTAYVGFTGSTGNEVTDALLYTWTYVPGMP